MFSNLLRTDSHILFFKFSVANNKLRPKGAKILAEMLSVSTSMTFLNLSCTCLCGVNEYVNGTYNTTGIKAIADALSVSTSLKSLK